MQIADLFTIIFDGLRENIPACGPVWYQKAVPGQLQLVHKHTNRVVFSGAYEVRLKI